MLIVFKYPVVMDDKFTLRLPESAKPLCVQCQHENPMLWVLLDPDAPKVDWEFRVAGTGHAIDPPPTGLDYVGTFQTHGGALVFHLFSFFFRPAQSSPHH